MSELPNPDLPDDIVADILLRLPAKPICRFKCVSKPWRSLLSNPRFARDHHKLHNHDPGDFILHSTVPDDSPYILSLAHGADSGVARKVPLLGSELAMKQVVVAGSCDGLLLLLLSDASPITLQTAKVLDEPDIISSKILVNPITLETAKVLGDPDIVSTRRRTYGFGYDNSSEDFKIVCLSQQENPIGFLMYGNYVLGRDVRSDVYSVRMKCWKRTADLPFTLCGCLTCENLSSFPSPGVYLNGCIHWFGLDDMSEFERLVCYDLAREQFVEGLLAPHMRFEFHVSVLKGCIALTSEWSGSRREPSFEVWVMREYGVPDSWTKFTTIMCTDCGSIMNSLDCMHYNAVCLLNEDEIVLVMCGELLAYNRRNETRRNLVIDDIPSYFHRVIPFRESLISPSYFM